MVKRVLKGCDAEKRALINQFLRYPENSAGSIMTIEYMELHVGTTVGEVLRLLGREDRAGRVVLGGPMTGRTVLDLELPLERGAGAVLALEAAECARYQNENGVCLHCGRCLSVCPMGLEPCHLLALEMAGAAAELEAQHVEACIECGACSYVCPAHLPLTRGIRRAKRLLRERRREGEE